MAKTSEAQLRSNAKHLASLDEFKIRVPKGKKAEYKEQAEERGLSLNAYVVKLLEADRQQGD